MRLVFLPKKISTALIFTVAGIFSVSLAITLALIVLRPSRALELKSSASFVVAQVDAVATGDQTATNTDGQGKTDTNNMAQTVDTGAIFLEPYLYDIREGRRNPFRPPADVDVPVQTGPSGMTGPISPLERYEIDDLKVIAIMWDVKRPRALIIDPNNEIHTAYKDERIGRKRGYVAVIRESEIVVVEPTTFSGETVYSTRILRITQ